MTEISENVRCSGEVEAIIEYRDGRVERISFPNTILKKGKEALAASLANEIGDSYDFYVSRMIFGDAGTSSGTKKFVNADRNGLFGVTRASKPVISSINPTVTTQVIFTSVLTYSDANGYTLNEMALQMNNGDLYSMVTWAGLSKTEEMQIVWNWRISYL